MESAKKCKRMRKNVKRKNLNTVASDERPLGFAPGELAPEWEFWAHTRQFSETGQSVVQASLRDDCLEVGTHSVTTQIPRKRLTRAGYEGHPFGRMEARRATKINVNFPTLAQPNPQDGAPAERKGKIKACRTSLIFPDWF